jgi:HEPN domain-containing protein
MRPEIVNIVGDWMKKAVADLRTAEVVLAATPPIVEDALFHCQQAAEKAMKAFLTAHDKPFHKTHDLDELAAACEAIAPELHSALDPARELSVFAWHFRYPGEIEVPEPSEAQSAIRTARRVCEAIESRLLS